MPRCGECALNLRVITPNEVNKKINYVDVGLEGA